jgi:hypothetical protein
MSTYQKFFYTNTTGGNLRVVIEPTAYQFLIPDGQRIEVEVRGDMTCGLLEFEQTQKFLIIYGYPQWDIALSCNGEPIEPSEQI